MSSIPKSLQARRCGKDNRHGIFQEHGLSPSTSFDRTRLVPALALLFLVGMRSFLTWSIKNGVVEGKVNKLKLIKRMGSGRADLHSYVSECFMLSETISCFGGSHASQCDGLVFLVAEQNQ